MINSLPLFTVKDKQLLFIIYVRKNLINFLI